MAETTFAAFAAHYLGGILSMADQPYEDGVEDFRRGLTAQVECIRAEKERYRREMDARRAEFERDYLARSRRVMVDELVAIEAAKAAQPAIGKPLSRRARRRNRGRVRAARMALGRTWHQPVQWLWSNTGGPDHAVS